MIRRATELLLPAWRPLVLTACLVTAVVCPASAHDPSVPPHADIAIAALNGRLHVQVTLPVSALMDANLKRDASNRIVGADVDAALRVIGRQLAEDLAIEQDGVPLPPPDFSGALSDDQTSASLALVYGTVSSGFSIRVHAYRAGADLLPAVVTYTPAGAQPRVFTVSGNPERILLEPALGAAVLHFVRLGADTVLTDGALLLLVLCLVVRRQSPSALLRPAGALIAAHAAGAIAGALILSTPNATPAAVAAGALAATAIVVLGAQTFVNPASRWVAAVTAVFGAAAGVVLAGRFVDQRALAGGHPIAAFAALVAAVSFAQAWMIALLSVAFGIVFAWIQSRGWPTRFVGIPVVVFAAHSALHRAADAGERLSGGSPLLDRWLVVLTLGWGVALLAAGVIDAMTSGAVPRPTGRPIAPTSHGPAR